MRTNLVATFALAVGLLGSIGPLAAQQSFQNVPAGNFPPPPGANGAPAPNEATDSPGFGNPGQQPGEVTRNQQPTRRNFADELTDFGVPPQVQLQTDVATPTPTTIPGGHVITTAEMTKAGDFGLLVVDVLQGPPHPSIPGALHMPGAGNGGTFTDPVQIKLWNALKQATNMNANRPIAFLCAGSRCWESYNAALRAQKMGFKMVLWYRGGLAAWRAAGLPLNNPGAGGPVPGASSDGPGFNNPD